MSGDISQNLKTLLHYASKVWTVLRRKLDGIVTKSVRGLQSRLTRSAHVHSASVWEYFLHVILCCAIRAIGVDHVDAQAGRERDGEREGACRLQQIRSASSHLASPCTFARNVFEVWFEVWTNNGQDEQFI